MAAPGVDVKFRSSNPSGRQPFSTVSLEASGLRVYPHRGVPAVKSLQSQAADPCAMDCRTTSHLSGFVEGFHQVVLALTTDPADSTFEPFYSNFLTHQKAAFPGSHPFVGI